MRARTVLLAAATLTAGFWPIAAADSPTVVQVPAPAVETVDGAELYAAYCSSCHGPTGRGDGAVANYLGTPAPDLTRISQRRGGFDPLVVRLDIAGPERKPDSVMPIWSSKLATTYENSIREAMILNNLVDHLESIQVPVEPPVAVVAGIAAHPKIELEPIPYVHSLDGATLFRAYCADCHGATGRGDGRLADRLGVAIPDLTRIEAREHGFDQRRVRDAIARRHMVPVADADPWWEVLSQSHGFLTGHRMLLALTEHVESLQAED